MTALRPGVSWKDMHLLANRVTLEDLTRAGVLTGRYREILKNKKCKGVGTYSQIPRGGGGDHWYQIQVYIPELYQRQVN